ncbi:MAG TPA: hypothetical protein O0X99_02630 [Methanocorpusculum sp.]|nr:hypothetical protein [Methanocorpusculum sp.]
MDSRIYVDHNGFEDRSNNNNMNGIHKNEVINASLPDIGKLELRIRDLEALVNGLTKELLDLKAVVRQNSMKMRNNPQPVSVTVNNVPKEDTPSRNNQNVGYKYIMQPDGTILKQKKGDDENVIIADTGYGQSKNSRSNTSAVIEAVDSEPKVKVLYNNKQ